jgi:N-acetylmuramoyl-L-alanine amidase
MFFILAGHCADKTSPSYDPGACANGVTEADLAKELRDLTVKHFDNKKDFKIDDDRDSLKIVIQKLKSVDSDIICDIHFNAAAAVSATGVEVITPFRATDKELKLAKDISTKFSKIMGIKNRGVKDETQTARKRLGIMQPMGINVLIEVCFITNPKDLAAYQSTKEALALSLYNSLKASV